MTDKELEKQDKPTCCKNCNCSKNSSWMIATIVLAVLFVVSLGFNVYFLVSRGSDMRRRDFSSQQMMGSGQNDWRGGNNNNNTRDRRGMSPQNDTPNQGDDAKDNSTSDNK